MIKLEPDGKHKPSSIIVVRLFHHNKDIPENGLQMHWFPQRSGFDIFFSSSNLNFLVFPLVLEHLSR